MANGEKGPNETILRTLSSSMGEPDWMLDVRLQSLRDFERQALPTGPAELESIEFDEIDGKRPGSNRNRGERDRTVDPAAAAADEESAQVFHRHDEELRQRGVIFCEMEVALREHADLVQPFFAKIVPSDLNKFAALNTAIWSGGSFIYVPPGVEVDLPLQAYFRTNAERMGCFERNLIIADEGAKVRYIEGCSAPVYSRDALHVGVVEVVVKRGAEVGFTAIQNWSQNVFNLVARRAVVEADGRMEWVDSNIGGRLTMAKPVTELVGRGASGCARSVTYAGHGQHQVVGAEMIHTAPESTSDVVSKVIVGDGGQVGFQTALTIVAEASGCVATANHDALLLDDRSVSDIGRSVGDAPADAAIDHSETTALLTDQQLFYPMSRGLSKQQATAMVVNGFADPVIGRLPMEYAVEWNRLIELQLQGSIG